MKDPSRINNTPSLSSIELILHGQFINDDNPFVEYMWMENEEEFNRQVLYLFCLLIDQILD